MRIQLVSVITYTTSFNFLPKKSCQYTLCKTRMAKSTAEEMGKDSVCFAAKFYKYLQAKLFEITNQPCTAPIAPARKTSFKFNFSHQLKVLGNLVRKVRPSVRKATFLLVIRWSWRSQMQWTEKNYKLKYLTENQPTTHLCMFSALQLFSFSALHLQFQLLL